MVVLPSPKLVFFVCIGIFSVEVLGVDPRGYFKGYLLMDKLAYIQCGVSDMPSTGSPIQIEISKVSPGEPFIIEHQAGKYEFITTTNKTGIIFKGMEKEDEGNYQCTVRAGDFQWTSKQFYLEYKVEASIEYIPRRHFLDLGQEFNLTCEASGYPVPTVYWGKEGSDFHSEGPILHFPSVTEEDSGQYFCIADNHGSKAARVDTNIRVPFFPAIVTAVNTTITTGRGWDKYVGLRCVVDGLPVPSVRYWKLKNGVRERVPNDRRKYLHNSNYIGDYSPDLYISTPRWHIMFIEELELTDSGTYFCTAENRLGRDEQEFTVLVV